MAAIKELWRDIPGFSKYQISSLGRIKNKKNIIQTGTINNRGYCQCHWKNDHGEDKIVMVHKLMALVFWDLIPNRGGKLQIDHIDGDKTNNSASNLRLVTAKENMNNVVRRHRLSTSITRQKRKHYYKIEYKDGRIFTFKDKKQIARISNCSVVTISRIISGEQKSNSFGISSITKIKDTETTLF